MAFARAIFIAWSNAGHLSRNAFVLSSGYMSERMLIASSFDRVGNIYILFIC
jgi:hypothetical protein